MNFLRISRHTADDDKNNCLVKTEDETLRGLLFLSTSSLEYHFGRSQKGKKVKKGELFLKGPNMDYKKGKKSKKRNYEETFIDTFIRSLISHQNLGDLHLDQFYPWI